jgi:hypothetical protein
MEGLAVAIQQAKITYPDGPIVKELESFEYEYSRTGVRYAAVDGMHDDCVCALALAWSIATIPQASFSTLSFRGDAVDPFHPAAETEADRDRRHLGHVLRISMMGGVNL